MTDEERKEQYGESYAAYKGVLEIRGFLESLSKRLDDLEELAGSIVKQAQSVKKKPGRPKKK